MAGDVAKGLFLLCLVLWNLTVGISEEVLPGGGGGAKRSQHRREAEEKTDLPSIRELARHGSPAARTTRRDVITNPVITAPVTFPTTTPAPGIITVPSTNPVTVLPGPVTIPSTTPVVNPIPVPATNPVTTPITVPSTIPAPPPPGVVPITNPVTTPSVPITPPITNPVTNYPFPPSTVVPVAPVGGGVPGTVPLAPAVAGQLWCVAKDGVMDAALQMALDYACGIGGADCSTIQQTGGCYNPNTLKDHASYAFNSYYQKNPSPTSCDFGGTAMLVNTNPSTATCTFSSTSSGTPLTNSYNPTTSGANPTASGTNPTGSTTVFGSSNPIGSGTVSTPSTTTTSNSLTLSIDLSWLLPLLLASLCLLICR